MNDERIKNIILRYLSPENKEPHYSILLNGEWGSGKTYFIKKEILPLLDSHYDVKYVSLFNVKTIEDIETELLVYSNINGLDKMLKNNIIGEIAEQSNNVLSNFTGLNLKDFSKLSSKNWLQDTKSSKDKKVKVLILDDLERTNINLEELFGFISNPLECSDIRIIFIANESEIKEGNKQIYFKYKEKVIGRTYNLQINIMDVVEKYMKSLGFNNSEIDVLKPLVSLIVDYIEDFSNIRILKNSLSLLKSFYNELVKSESILNNIRCYTSINKTYKYFELIVLLFLLLDIHRQIGAITENITIEDISNLMCAFNNRKQYLKYKKEKSEAENLDEILAIQIEHISFIPLSLYPNNNAEFWNILLFEGFCDFDMLKLYIDNDITYYREKKNGNEDVIYELLSQGYKLDKDAFYAKQSKLIKELKNNNFDKIEAYIAGYNLLVCFMNNDLLKDSFTSIEEIVEFIKKCIDTFELSLTLTEIFEMGRFTEKDEIAGFDIEIRCLHYKNYGLMTIRDNIDSYKKGFLDIKRYIEEKLMKYIETKEVRELEKTLKKISQNEDCDIFGELSGFNMYRASAFKEYPTFCFSPVLKNINNKIILDFLDTVSFDIQLHFYSILEDRYAHTNLRRYFWIEKECIISIYNYYNDKYLMALKDRNNKVLIYRVLKEKYENMLNNIK